VNFGPKLNFGPKIEFRALMGISGQKLNFGPSEMSPARLSNYGPGRGPRARPMGQSGMARNSNNTGLFGLGSGDPNVHL
jgi:hypothetical protein